MKTTIYTCCVFILFGTCAFAALPVIPWDIDTTSVLPVQREIIRGESLYLRPRFLDGRMPMNLTDVYSVVLRYRADTMAEGSYYIATGTVHNASAGIVQIAWTPAMEPADNTVRYQLVASSAAGGNLRGFGTIRFIGSIQGDPQAMTPTVAATFDWANINEHLNTESAPFVGPADILAINQRVDGQDVAISNVVDLVGVGVSGVDNNLQAHIAAQDIRDNAQDDLIQVALDSATMGYDITGVSSQAVVVATRGRPFPTEADVPADMEAIVWDSSLNAGAGGYKHGSVDLSGIEANISNLQATAVSQVYVDTEVSRVAGLIDGNTHVITFSEGFASGNWLEIAPDTWQHDTGWMAYSASVSGGNITLLPQYGVLRIGVTNHISRIRALPTDYPWAYWHGETVAGPWIQYDAGKDHIAFTNRFAVMLHNTSSVPITVSTLQLYSWEYPERVGLVRDFAGMTLDLDTPTGSRPRESANVQYVQAQVGQPASQDISGTLPTGFNVDRIKGGLVNPSSRATGFGLVWFDSVQEHRYIDLATQFELDAAIGPLASGANVTMGGDVWGKAGSNTIMRLRGTDIDPVGGDGTSPVYDLNLGKVVWRSIMSSNVIYAAGTNAIEAVPAQSAAFYRAEYAGGYIMPLVLDQQIIGWLGDDGLSIPYGTINILQSNLTANVRLYDGSAAAPALSTLSDPDTGWYRIESGKWGYTANGTNAATIGPDGIAVAAGKTVILGDGYRAVSIDEIDTGSIIEQDPHAVLKSGIESYWTDAGGTYTNQQLVATSTLSSNGYARVSYDKTGALAVQIEMADLNLSEWVPFAPFVSPGYVRVQLVDLIPSPGMDMTTSISNIVASTWTHPELFGVTTDTAGQIIHVDTAAEARQPVPLAQMQAAIAADVPTTWSAYPATQTVRLNGNKMLMGSGWSAIETDGVGVISYADVWGGTNGLVIANNGTPAITALSGLQGLQIASFSLDSGTGTVNIATNGVASQPLLQWTADLMEIDWQILSPISESWPDTTNGYYQIIAEMPAGPAGFIRAVRETGAARVDVHSALYEMGERVATQSQLSGIYLSGTNLLIVIDGVTNRVITEVWAP
jgi:hypothetical protein